MKIERFIPSDRLKPFVKTFMIIESEDGTVNRILPDTSVVMAFRIKGKVAYSPDNPLPVSAISGLSKTARFVEYSKDTATFLVIFREGGAAAFLKEPLHELAGQSLSLDNGFGLKRLNETEDSLNRAASDAERVSVIEKFLLANLRMSRADDDLVSAAVQQIKTGKGNVRITDIASHLNISVDPFEKRFRNIVGVSPKRFSSIVRLRHIIAAYSPGQSLTSLAYDAGFFDQSHFIKEFKLFTGQSPKDFFESGEFW